MLGEHVFDRGPGKYSDDESMIIFRDYKGRPVVDGRTVVCWYKDALVRWNLDTRVPVELLAARRSDDGLFAMCTSCVVTTDEEGSLVVNRDGCRVTVIPNTVKEEGRSGLAASENISFSLGIDGSLEAWETTHMELVASVHIDLKAESAMYFDDSAEAVVVSDIDAGVVYFFDNELNQKKTIENLPVVTSDGWIPAHGLAAGIASFKQDPAVYCLDLDSGQFSSFLLPRSATAVALLNDTGELLIDNKFEYRIAGPNGTRVSESRPSMHAQHLVPIPETAEVLAFNAGSGIEILDTTTFRTVGKLEDPQ